MKILILLFIFYFASLLPVLSTDIEKYDNILSRLDLKEKEQQNEKPKKLYLTFEHENMPTLDGVWTFKKKVIKRINTPLVKPNVRTHCNSRIPFTENVLEKDIVISAQGIDYFIFRAIEPVSNSVYLNSTMTNESEYQNFGFKGNLTPGEVNYVYTLKLVNHIENPAFIRQLWFKGKITFEKISDRKIIGKGYELEYTPECLGFIRDEIEFEMTRQEKLASRI